MQVEATGTAVVNEPHNVFPTCVTYPHDWPRGLGLEAEIAFLVEGVDYGGWCQCTCPVEVEFAGVAFVFEPNAGLLAPVAVEWDLGVFTLELVLGVAGVKDLFIELHGSCLIFLRVLFVSILTWLL